MTRTLAVLFLLLPAAVAERPLSVDQIPVLDRPADHFYGAIADAKGVTVRWEVSPAAVPRGEACTLTLVVSHAANPHELTRPPLLDLPEFRELFTAVDDLPDEPNTPGEVAFRYRVSPRNEGNLRVPELTYRFYHTRAPIGRRTQTAFARPVTLTVTKPAEVLTAVPLDAPADYFGVRTDGTFARSGGPNVQAWVGLFAAGVVVAAGWVAVWRVLFPDAARLTRIRRVKAVRAALDRLRRPNVSAEVVAICLRNYLIARFGLAFTAQTPAEVAAGLLEAGLQPERAREAEGLLRACDAARFGNDTGVSVADRAVATIERWEGVG